MARIAGVDEKEETRPMPNRAFAATKSVSADEVERSWYVVDAEDLVLGRLATRIATVLRLARGPDRLQWLDFVKTGHGIFLHSRILFLATAVMSRTNHWTVTSDIGFRVKFLSLRSGEEGVRGMA